MKMKHYTEKLPKKIKLLMKELNIKVNWFDTYADLLDKLFEIGYWIELRPFRTFAISDKAAFLLKIWRRNEELKWDCIYNEESVWTSKEGFGGNFWYSIELMLNKIKIDIK